MQLKSDWTFEEIHSLYHTPLLELVLRAGVVQQAHHQKNEIQVCNLISLKTGGCSEDCHYCPQAARYHTNVKPTAFMSEEEALQLAQYAIQKGATRICLGAAWRGVKDNKQFEQALNIFRKIHALGVEVCCTLGMLNQAQAQRLKQAGVYAYNHNLDSSAEFYQKIITTRHYRDRLTTLDLIQEAGLQVCCGGIIGMGETHNDRIHLLQTLASRNPHPESVPINSLIPVKGTPLEDKPLVPIWDLLRMIATARILMPKAMIRLSAGRLERNLTEQALCFIAGANSIFSGEKLLTRPNPDFDQDLAMLKLFGLSTRPAFKEE